VKISITLQNDTTSVSLTCEADGATSYTWQRQNGNIPSGATGVNTDMLTLNNLQLEDVGNYRCVATNEGGSAQSNYASLFITGECNSINNVLISYSKSSILK